MFKIASPYLIRAISSLHCGSGNDLGIIDLPIQRERHTGFPKIESSSLKGGIREAFETLPDDKKLKIIDEKSKAAAAGTVNLFEFNELISGIGNYDFSLHLLFGYDEDGAHNEVKKKFEENSEFSGALGFSDARILFFPVKSMKGIFAWVTCPYVLKRFTEDLNLTGADYGLSSFSVSAGSCLVAGKNVIAEKEKVVLEEYTFNALQLPEGDAAKFEKLNGIISGLTQRLVVLSDDDFKDFVSLSTEVITRTKIDNATGTVKGGALFNEEYLPPETIMYYIVFASPVFMKEKKMKELFTASGDEATSVLNFFESALPPVIQLGGNATIGKGVIKTNKLEV